MWARFSEVAARHPNAWTRNPLTAEEITTPSADNRPIAFPYTKRMVSLVMADIGAAIIMTTARRAARTRDGAAQRVHFLGGGFAKDRQRFMAEKSDFTRSPALAPERFPN
jgi:acetyl-CoA C-acetyltransferase